MTSKKKSDSDPAGEAPEEVKFEDAVGRLEEIVRRMEEDQMPLDELIRSYESGTQLLRVCRERIELARARIEMIGREGADGVVLEDFEPTSGEEATGKKEKIQLL